MASQSSCHLHLLPYLLLLLLPILLFSFTAHGCSYMPSEVVIQKVQENATVGTIVPILVRNSSFGSDTFAIEKKSPTPFPFDFLAVNISVNVTGSLDRETIAAYTFQLNCLQGGVNKKQVIVMIQLLDIDDTSPQWTSPGNYSVSINEGNAIGALLPLTTSDPRPQITDRDDPNSQTWEISIVPSEYSSYFQVQNPSTTTPDIKVMKKLDYETKNSYNITLMFKDIDLSGNMLFNGTAPLNVFVLNVEDEAPRFGHAKYRTVVTANATKGRVLQLQPANLLAWDGDISINATVNYAMLTPDTIVDVNATTGAISLNRNNPTPNFYTVHVQAFQVNDRKRQNVVPVEINITSSSLVPVCQRPVRTVSVREDSPVDFRIATMDVSYPIQSQLTYTQKTQTTVFAINDGALVLKQKLDYETSKTYQVVVDVSNGGSTSTCTININVVDINDNSPIFNQSSYDFKTLTTAYGSKIGVVSATDRDANSVLTYSIKTSGSPFSVDRISGAIKINTTTGFSEKTYSFLVVVTDNGSPPRQAQAFVRVSTDPAAMVASADSLVIAMATLGGLLVFVLITAAIVFCLYRKRYLKHSPTSAKGQNGQTDSRYFYENQAGTETPTAWTNIPSPLEAMYKEYCTKDQPDGNASGSGNGPGGGAVEQDEAPCVNLGTEYSTGPGSIRSVVSGQSGGRAVTSLSHRHRIVPTPVVDSPTELSEVEGSIESYSIGHDTPPPPAIQSPQPRLNNMQSLDNLNAIH